MRLNCLFDIRLVIQLLLLFSVTAAEVAEDSSLLAIGFSDSGIKVWSLIPQKLRLMKTGEQLHDIEREAGNICTEVIKEEISLSCFKDKISSVVF